MTPVKQIKRIKHEISQAGPLRVAAYCRVSSDSTDQLHSYAAQIQYYTEYIGQHPGWILADIYADEGLTGTKTDKRDDLMRLITDCRKGKIDRVIIKTVSRFARNTYDCLLLARELKSYGVSIYFQEQDLDTADMSDEMFFAMAGAVAQEESITISNNMRWSCKRRMEDGTYLASNPAYGYMLENGKYVIIPEQAEVVRFIFNSFLSGKGKMEIIKDLYAMDAPKRFGYTKWHISTINCILNNTRYMGDAIFQKKFSTDEFPFRRKVNKGQKPMYYVEDTNPPIISADVFEAAQQLQKQRKNNNPGVGNPRPLTKKIICSCDHTYRYKQINGTPTWECRKHNFNADHCSLPAIRESVIYNSFMLLVNKLATSREYILSPMIQQLERMQSRNSDTQSRIYELDKEIAEINQQLHSLAGHRTRGIIDTAEHTARAGVMNKNIGNLRAKRRKVLAEDETDTMIDELRTLYNIISLTDTQISFDEHLFEKIVCSVKVLSNSELCFRLSGGLELTEKTT